MDYIDTDGTGRISYKNFLNFTLPKCNSLLRSRVLNREHYTNTLVSYDVEWALTRVFNNEVKNQR